MMTTETYMRRFHGEGREGASCPLTAEEAFPISRRVDRDGCPCRERGMDSTGCPRRRDDGCGCDRDRDRDDRCGCDRDRDDDRRCDRDRDRDRDDDRRCPGLSGLENGGNGNGNDDDDDECCCKASMVEALRLLCGECLSNLVDFDKFFFLTDSLAVGSTLACHCVHTDNIEYPDASLERFSPCNCDLLDVDGTAYVAIPGSDCVVLEDVDQLSICALKAVAFQLKEAECPRDCDDTNFHRAVRALRRAIRAEGGDTGACARCGSHCDCDNCCCAQGVLTELSKRNLSREATLTVGTVVLKDVTVLGSIGNVLVLASECLERIYFVCANQVEALG